MAAAKEGTLDVVLKMINDKIETRDPYFFVGTFVSLFVVFLTIVFLFFRGKSSARRNILLVGLSDSGKTTLFSRLVYKEVPSTHTSIKENSGFYIISAEKKRTASVIDLPGHERLRSKFFEQYKTSARGIVFVIDSLTFQKDLKDVAEFIYNILTDGTVVQNALPIFVACNKNDQTLAKGPQVIRSALEKELNNVRTTRSAALSTTDGKSSTSFLGKRDHDFTFADAKPVRVEFAECSAKGSASKNESNLEQLKEWLLRVA